MQSFKKMKICRGWSLNWFRQCRYSYWLSVPVDADVGAIKRYLRDLPGSFGCFIDVDAGNGRDIYFSTSLGFNEIAIKLNQINKGVPDMKEPPKTMLCTR